MEGKRRGRRRRIKNWEKISSTQTFPYSCWGRECLSYNELACSRRGSRPSQTFFCGDKQTEILGLL